MAANIVDVTIIVVVIVVVLFFGIIPSQLDRQTIVAERMVAENERVGADVRRGSEPNVLFAACGEIGSSSIVLVIVLFVRKASFGTVVVITITAVDAVAAAVAAATRDADSGRRGRKRR